MLHFDYTVNWGTVFDLIMVWLGRKLLRLAAEAKQSLGVVFWEHKVMWTDWASKNKVPHHPYLKAEESSGD